MFKLKETVLVTNPVEALQEENGSFLITAPNGDSLQVQVEAGYALVDHASYLPEAKRTDLLWAITKLGDYQSGKLPEALPKESAAPAVPDTSERTSSSRAE